MQHCTYIVYMYIDEVHTPVLNPSSPNRDQQQFSPNNVHTLLRDKVVRM